MGQIGTIGVETQNSGTVKVSVFNTGDSGSDVYEMVRVQTQNNGVGFIPVISNTSEASFPYLRVQTQNHGVCAVHNEAVLEPEFAQIQTLTDLSNGKPTALSFSPGGSKLVVGNRAGDPEYVYNTSDYSQDGTLSAIETTYIEWSPDGNNIVVNNGSIYFFDTSYSQVRSFSHVQSSAFSGGWEPNSNYYVAGLATGGGTHTVNVYDTSDSNPSNWSQVDKYTTSFDQPTAIHWKPDSSYIAVGANNEPTVEILDSSNPSSLSHAADLSNVDDATNGLAWNSTGTRLVVSEDSNAQANIYDTSDSNPSNWSQISDSPLTKGTGEIEGIVFSEDNSHLAYGTADDTIRIYNTSDWTETSTSPLTASGMTDPGGWPGSGLDWCAEMGHIAATSDGGDTFVFES